MITLITFIALINLITLINVMNLGVATHPPSNRGGIRGADDHELPWTRVTDESAAA